MRSFAGSKSASKLITDDMTGEDIVTGAVEKYMQAAFDAAKQGMADGMGGPFGAAVVKDGEIIAVGANQVVRTTDPTAHAEIAAIRSACRALKTHVLDGCTLYCTTEPCPMCLAAIYWARIDRVFFATTRDDAARAGFDDALIYHEVALPIAKRRLPMIYLEVPEVRSLFQAWRRHPSKVPY